MLLNNNEFHKVVGEIYIIKNTVTNKSYVGQTRSHRLNHGKYRPFGYLGRFKDHICESTSNKKNQSRYLNSSLLKYGFDAFICEQILTCNLDELDKYEAQYITEYNTKFPNGYNLTDGGQGNGCFKGNKVVLDETLIVQPPTKIKPCLTKSDYTKALIAIRVKESISDPEHRIMMMQNAQQQHLSSKFERFKNVIVDETNIAKYIYIIHNNIQNYDYVRIVICKIRTNFVGKHETIDQIKERAITFIKELIKWQRDQIAGNPLEPLLPLTLRNICEELV